MSHKKQKDSYSCQSVPCGFLHKYFKMFREAPCEGGGDKNALEMHHMLADPAQHQTDAEVDNMVLELCKTASWMDSGFPSLARHWSFCKKNKK